MNVYFERNLENSLDRVPFQMAVYAARKRISFNFDHICITIPLPQETTSDAVQLSGTKYANFSPFSLSLSFFSKHHNFQFMYIVSFSLFSKIIFYLVKVKEDFFLPTKNEGNIRGIALSRIQRTFFFHFSPPVSHSLY